VKNFPPHFLDQSVSMPAQFLSFLVRFFFVVCSLGENYFSVFPPHISLRFFFPLRRAGLFTGYSTGDVWSFALSIFSSEVKTLDKFPDGISPVSLVWR